jgi:hypothetical protein
VPDDGLPGLIRPYFGSASPDQQIINRESIRQEFLLPILLLFICSLASAVGKKQILILVPSLLVFLDVALPESLSNIMPLATVSRLFPYLFFLPLTDSCFAISATLIAIQATTRKEIILVSTVLVALIVAGLGGRSSQRTEFRTITRHPTPSLFVEQHTHGLLVPPNSALTTSSDFSLTTNLLGDVSPNHGGHFHPRLHSQGQSGHEFLRITTAMKSRILGVVLSTGSFQSDYPRAVSIDDCEQNQPLLTSYRWLGSLDSTTSGDLYFHSQADANQRFIFFKPAETTCLEIRQVDQAPQFDWSVTRISLIKE